MYDMAIKNGEIYYKSEFHKLNIYIQDGKIETISEEIFDAKENINANGNKVLPGLIDPHVHLHLNIGRYTSADDFYSGSRAAIYGGVTTIIDFLDPVSRGSDVEKAFNKRMELAKKSLIDFTFHTTVANPIGETERITQEALRLKIPSIKLFTTYSDSNRRTYEKEITELLELSEIHGTIILIHSEDEDYMDTSSGLTFRDLSINRPVLTETSMVKKLSALNKKHGGRIYSVHTTCGESLEYLIEFHPDLLNKSYFIESCPHYFVFDDSNFQKDDGYRYILAPPLRPLDQVERLKANIKSVYSIGTDHCPFLLEQKKSIYLKDIPFGIGGLEYSFHTMFRIYGYEILDKMTINPAKLFNLYPRKGVLQEGSDADLFIFDDKVESEIIENHSNCDYNLYKGMKKSGSIETVIIGGQMVKTDNKILERNGQFIERESHDRFY